MSRSLPPIAHYCQGCTLNRRNFVKTLAAGSLATGLLSSNFSSLSAGVKPGDYIDLASFRPRPEVKIASALLRLPPPYWLGWPGTSYDLEGKRKEYDLAFQQSAQKVGITLQTKPDPIENESDLGKFIEEIKVEKPDAVMVHLQHMAVWGWADQVTKAGIPTIVFAPIGMGFTGHVLDISKRPGVHVISSLEVAAMEQAFRMIRAKKQFEATRLMVVMGEARNETVLENLGTRVKYVPRDLLNETFNKIPETDEAHEVAEQMFKNADKIVEPNNQDGLNAARSYIAAKALLEQEGCNALTTDCLGMVANKVVPTPPCMAASIFQDQGITYGCEGDVFGALSLMLTSYLFDKPGFMNDPVPETYKNLLITAHCVCGTRLNGFGEAPEPYALRSHSESNIGVSLQVYWKPDHPVTLVRFNSPTELIVDTGKVVSNVDTPPAGGCRTNFEIAMDDVEDCREVLGFHQVVFYGNHKRDVEAFCQMNGIKVIHSPEKTA